MQYIRDRYNVPAKRGGRIKYDGKPGEIVGASNGYLRIRLDGKTEIGSYHPTYQIEYLN